MSVRQIIFSAPMVRALLDGRKTQTRRVLKPQPTMGDSDRDMLDMARYARGDLLWVREAHAMQSDWNRHDGFVHYAADDHTWHTGPNTGDIPDDSLAAWFRVVDRSRDQNCAVIRRSPIHMPRWASRLTLRVTDVRVQRVQDITLGDCWAEGCETGRDLIGAHAIPKGAALPFKEFRDLWDSIHSKARGTANGCNANPWVCALTFDVIRANVDEVQG